MDLGTTSQMRRHIEGLCVLCMMVVACGAPSQSIPNKAQPPAAPKQAANQDDCPGTPPGAGVEGHTTAQSDLDDIAHAVLARFELDQSTMPDGDLFAAGEVRVSLDLGEPRDGHLDASALPRGTTRRFVGTSSAELQAQADRTQREVAYVSFQTIDADGRCALVSVGVELAMPRKTRGVKLCCCTGTYVYEKRGGSWTFGGQTSMSCG